jgi:hypothetical protein
MPKPNLRFSRKRKREACSSRKPVARIRNPEFRSRNPEDKRLVWHDPARLGVWNAIRHDSGRSKISIVPVGPEWVSRLRNPTLKWELLSSVIAERSHTVVLS